MTTASIRVAHGHVVPDEYECWVRFRCTKCGIEAVLNAYDGPPVCESGHAVAWMDPLTVVRSRPHPDSRVREHR